MNQDQMTALDTIIDYLWKDEQKNYEEDPRDNHVFSSLEVLRQYADNAKRTPMASGSRYIYLLGL